MRDGGHVQLLEAAVYLLEDAIECWVVNAREVKNVPGRPKTGWMRCGCASWLSGECCAPSFVPPPWQRELRDVLDA